MDNVNTAVRPEDQAKMRNRLVADAMAQLLDAPLATVLRVVDALERAEGFALGAEDQSEIIRGALAELASLNNEPEHDVVERFGGDTLLMVIDDDHRIVCCYGLTHGVGFTPKQAYNRDLGFIARKLHSLACCTAVELARSSHRHSTTEDSHWVYSAFRLAERVLLIMDRRRS